MPPVPVCIELAIQYGFPVPSGMTVGILFAFGEVFSPLFGYILSNITEYET